MDPHSSVLNSRSVPAKSSYSSMHSRQSTSKSQSVKAADGKFKLQAKNWTLNPIQEDGPAKCEDVSDAEYAAKSDARRQEIKMMISNAQGLDLCFLIDATLSMREYIDLVRERVADMAAAIKATYPACCLRVSCVIYRDYDDTQSNEDASCDFTSDFQRVWGTFKKYLSSVRLAAGDGDYAEDVFTGLERAARLDWQAKNRLLVHIGDAPCHGNQFHILPEGSGWDKYPKGDKLGREIVDLLQKLYGDCKISHYFFCRLRASTKKMLQEFKKAISADGWIKETSFQNIDDIPQEVISIARTTISKTMHTTSFRTSGSGLAGELCGIHLETTIVPRMPEWEKINSLKGRRFKHRSYGSVDDLLTKIRNRQILEVEKIHTVDIKIAPNPFSSEGAARWPFYASILDPDGNRDMVVKRFKISRGHSMETFHAEERYMQQMEVQTVADHLAREFNDRTQSPENLVPNLNQVDFILVSTLNAGFKFFNMEKYLKGTWIRYSNNAGYVNTQEYAPTLQAFTHWTYERSGGLLMVTDLQGVMKPEGSDGKYNFFLSDPAIHCSDVLRFAETNLGEEGFELFFHSHKCNDICQKLGLKSTAEPKREEID